MERFSFAVFAEEYEQVVNETERFREEIAREGRKGKITFVELKDKESNLERLRGYLAQVVACEAFGAESRARGLRSSAALKRWRLSHMRATGIRGLPKERKSL